MKIAFILGHELPFPSDKGGGVNALIYELCKSLYKAGNEIVVFSPKTSGRPDKEMLEGVLLIRVKGAQRHPNHYLNFINGTRYALGIYNKMSSYDVISCHLWQGFLFSRTKKAKVVTYTVHRKPKKLLCLFMKMHRIYTGSDAVTEEAKEKAPQIKNILKTIYNCVDFSDYVRCKNRVRDGNIKFLFIGRFTKDKGVDVLIEAFCRAAMKNKNITLKTIGPMLDSMDGDEQLWSAMEERVIISKLEKQIEFKEPIFDRKLLDEEIANNDIIVLPSTYGETLNMSILESMRIGRALLISNLPANLPLIKECETGYLANTNDVNDWENKINLLASDIDRIERFGRAAYLYGKENFSTSKIAVEYIHDFIQLIDSSKK